MDCAPYCVSSFKWTCQWFDKTIRKFRIGRGARHSNSLSHQNVNKNNAILWSLCLPGPRPSHLLDIANLKVSISAQLSAPRLCIKIQLKMGQSFSLGCELVFASEFTSDSEPLRQLTIFVFSSYIEVCVPLSSTSGQSFHSSPSPFMRPRKFHICHNVELLLPMSLTGGHFAIPPQHPSHFRPVQPSRTTSVQWVHVAVPYQLPP